VTQIKLILIIVGVLIAGGGIGWFTHHLIGEGEQICHQQDNSALLRMIATQKQQLEEEVTTNAILAKQHLADVQAIADGAARAATDLAHVRVRCPAGHNSPVPGGVPATGSRSGPASPVNGGNGEGLEEIDLSSIVPDLKSCELDAAELNVMKGWAKGVLKRHANST
jgi:hypothetical protein